MDREDKIELEEAPKGMFPEDDDEDSYEIELDEDLDVWNRGSGYTWGGGTSWWQKSPSIGSSMSSMWSWGGTSYTHNNASRMLKHKTHIDSLCKITDPTVPHTLDFASDASGYTDMRRGRIVVDGNLIKDNDDKLDVLSGLAIHEKLHVIHSKPLMAWQNDKKYELCKTHGQQELFHSIANIVEDEYIERQLHKTCAGYVHYIESCKKHYFASQSDKINSEINDFSDMVNTFLMLVRYPSEIDMDRRKRHAPHIRVFMTAIRKGIDSRDATYTCIETVYRYLVAQAEKIAEESGKSQEEIEEEMTERAKEYADKRYEEEFGDFPLDDDQKKEMVKALAKDMFDKLMRREKRDKSDAVDTLWDAEAKKALKDITEYISEEIDESLRKEINELADSDYYETSIDKAIALKNGQRDISWQRAMPNETCKDQYKSDKSRMQPQISKLKKKLQLYGNLQKHHIYNQKRGILDKRQLHKIPMGMTDIFRATIVNEDKPLDICILVDESGSMGWHTMSHARQGAIAVKEALADNEMINLWVYGHSADESVKGRTDMIEYWSPTMKDRPMAMGGMKARYENRDGNAIVASADRIKSESDNGAHKLMIVMSDGAPSADGYRGGDAKDHTKKCVKHIETRGWSVIQVGFAGAYDWMMRDMFDNWVYVDDTDKLGDQLSKIIRKVVKI